MGHTYCDNIMRHNGVYQLYLEGQHLPLGLILSHYCIVVSRALIIMSAMRLIWIVCLFFMSIGITLLVECTPINPYTARLVLAPWTLGWGGPPLPISILLITDR